MQNKAQVIFLSHGGGPLPLLNDPGHQSMRICLQEIVQGIQRPSTILVISAHWEEKEPTLTASQNPELLYDYYGFPEESYSIPYSCPGSPDWAEKIAKTLQQGGWQAHTDSRRGLDHGVFVPLKIMYPEADIPCLQLSLLGHLDAESHLRLGHTLANALDGSILVVGSGFSFHNMQAFFSPGTPEIQKQNEAFEDWLTDTCSNPKLDEIERTQRLIGWEKAPYARFCHPREEHLLPLHVCYGIAGRACRQFYSIEVMGKKASFFLW